MLTRDDSGAGEKIEKGRNRTLLKKVHAIQRYSTKFGVKYERWEKRRVREKKQPEHLKRVSMIRNQQVVSSNLIAGSR